METNTEPVDDRFVIVNVWLNKKEHVDLIERAKVQGAEMTLNEFIRTTFGFGATVKEVLPQGRRRATPVRTKTAEHIVKKPAKKAAAKKATTKRPRKKVVEKKKAEIEIPLGDPLVVTSDGTGGEEK